MSGFEGPNIYYSEQNLQYGNNQQPNQTGTQIDGNLALKLFKMLIKTWSENNQLIYRNQLIDNAENENYSLSININSLSKFSEQLYSVLCKRPNDFIPVFELATKELYQEFKNSDKSPNFQVQFFSQEIPKPLRYLKSSVLNELVTIQGIIVNVSRIFIRASDLVVQCSNCKHTIHLKVPQGMGSIIIPRLCQAPQDQAQQGKDKCPMDSYNIVSDKCVFYDQQLFKLQESPEDIPTGEIPRTFQICVDRYLTNKLAPGSRVIITGIYQVNDQKYLSQNKGMPKNLKEPYIYALGITQQSSLKRSQKLFEDKEEEAILAMSKDPKIYEKITNSIAPALFGNEDIKKAIACLLFGGTRKILPDKMRLRGDINILLIGDPSTGKSQFLKFVERTAPISVYTSGKGSSAAGLTASITRDKQSGEFTIEVGAMVLGDGGVVCIDEFDKMKPQDRVAIHEAMEQQTISIAKADITTKLNSRTSVLAAANPIFGSYNDLKQIEEQIELQTTILSRFDCIFIVRDIKSEAHDKKMAEHILNLHIQGGNMQLEQDQIQQGDFTNEQLKKYIAFAKARIHPTLTEQSAEKIKSLYVEDRQKSLQKGTTQKKQHIPVTVRQLEAIIRLSEAVAKIHLSQEVKEEHIEEAHRLFQNSTLNAISSGKEIGIELPQQMEKYILKMEESIKKRVSINQKVDFTKLKEEMEARFHNEKCFDYAITNLIKNKVFQHVEGKRVIQRIR